MSCPSRFDRVFTTFETLGASDAEKARQKIREHLNLAYDSLLRDIQQLPNAAKPKPRGTTDFQSVAIRVAVTVAGLEIRRTEIRARRADLTSDGSNMLSNISLYLGRKGWLSV